MGQMGFELPQGIILQFLSYKVVVLIKNPDGGDQLKTRHVAGGKHTEVVFERNSDTAKPAILPQIHQFVIVILTDWKSQHHRQIEGPGRFVVQQINTTLKRRGAKQINIKLYSGVSVSGGGLAERDAWCHARRYKLQGDIGIDIDIDTTPDEVNGKRQRPIEQCHVAGPGSDKDIGLSVRVRIDVLTWGELLGAGGLHIQV